MHARQVTIATILLVLFLTSCASFRFGPGFSMMDRDYFMEKPYIVSRTGGYSLRWRYGKWGYYFIPSSNVVDGKLLFALQAASSSGARTGRYGEIQIAKPKQILALENGGAFWVEPNGKQIRLEIVTDKPD